MSHDFTVFCAWEFRLVSLDADTIQGSGLRL